MPSGKEYSGFLTSGIFPVPSTVVISSNVPPVSTSPEERVRLTRRSPTALRENAEGASGNGWTVRVIGADSRETLRWFVPEPKKLPNGSLQIGRAHV